MVGDLNLCKDAAPLQPGGAASAKGCQVSCWCMCEGAQRICVQVAAKTWQIREAEDTAVAPRCHSGA